MLDGILKIDMLRESMFSLLLDSNQFEGSFRSINLPESVEELCVADNRRSATVSFPKRPSRLRLLDLSGKPLSGKVHKCEISTDILQIIYARAIRWNIQIGNSYFRHNLFQIRNIVYTAPMVFEHS